MLRPRPPAMTPPCYSCRLATHEALVALQPSLPPQPSLPQAARSPRCPKASPPRRSFHRCHVPRRRAGPPPCCAGMHVGLLALKIFLNKSCHQIIIENFSVKTNLPPSKHRNLVTNINHWSMSPTLVTFHHYFVIKIRWQFHDNLPPNFVTENNRWQVVTILLPT